MEWRRDPPPARRPHDVLESGPIRLSVSDAEGDPSLRWRYFTLTLGYHTPASHADCLRDWPQQAIAHARAALDEFEARLAEMEG